mgnify:CR=1 FL=1
MLAQKYSSYEVLVINDHSTDGSAELLEALSLKFSSLKVLEFTKTKVGRGKKEALVFGVENASYPYLLFTDADCKPAGKHWLRTMASSFQSKEIVLGISPYYFQNNLTGWITAWETFLTAQQYMSFAMAGMPYMGVGRNLAYTKSVFEKSSKMQQHLQLPSGDDALLISEVATSGNVALNIEKEGYTYSPGPDSFEGWWHQKRRHLSTSYRYNPGVAIPLALFGMGQVLFYLLLLPVTLFCWDVWWFQILLWGKLTLQIVTMMGFAAKTGQLRVLCFFIIIEPLVVFLLSVIHFQNKILGNSKDW